MAEKIDFVCWKCNEHFTRPVEQFVNDPRKVVYAPTLCEDCEQQGGD